MSRHGHQDGSDLFQSGCGLPPRRTRRRSGVDRTGTVQSQLFAYSVQHPCLSDDRSGRCAPRLRVSVAGHLLRRDLPGFWHYFHRTLSQGHGNDGRQIIGAETYGRRGPASAWRDRKASGQLRRGTAKVGGGWLPHHFEMQVVWNRSELASALENVRNTAQAVFKDNRVYLEKFIRDARHVEVQVMGDRHGNVVYLGERDCSIQRRQQKLIEESPSTYIDEDLRRRIGEAAAAGAKSIGYESAGTMEFLVDCDRNFYFMEMNTRIQVEHPVTETTTGLDIVELMIRVAAGEPLPVKQQDIKPRGHAIECRVNAEDPANNWKGASGTLTRFIPPGGPRVRVDTHAHSGYNIPPFYDSLLAKVIVHGNDRMHALEIMRRALGEFACEGVKTTIPFHLELLAHPVFRSGDYHLDFIEKYMTPEGTLLVPQESAMRRAM